MSPRGFSLVELLVALTVCALISSAIAGIVGPARAAFETTPDALDVQQRNRTAADAIARSLRSGGGVAGPNAEPAPFPAALLLDPDGAGGARFSSLYVVSRSGAAHAIVESDQAAPGAPLIASASPCPASGTLCGFVEGMTAAIADQAGRFDVFEIVGVDAGARSLTASVPFDPPYSEGSVIVAVEADRYWLDRHDNGSHTLMRTTAGGAVQPLIDDVADVSFEGWRSNGSALDLAPLTIAETQDGPWNQGGPDGVYDDDMRRLRRIDITLRINSRSAQVPDRTLNLSIGLRNVS